MPVITITMAAGQATREQKKQLVESFTTQAVEITKIPAQAFTILIHELNRDAIGVAGQTLEERLKNH